ncbi:MAG TPA: roadblock/LC7 domain-containing protein [Candidatus Methanoperedens sp.]
MKGGKVSKIVDDIIHDLKISEGVKKVAVGSRDGFLISGNQNEESETLTMMSATILRAAESIAFSLDRSCLEKVIIDFEGGRLITKSAGQKALVSVVAATNVNMNHIETKLEKAAGKIREIF